MHVACPICHRTFSIVERVFTRCPNCDRSLDPIELLTVSIDPDATALADSATVSSKLLPGEQLAQFRLIKVIGKGGFGTVFEAYDSRLERHVALKVPSRATLARDQAKAFIKEARAAAKLRHPNVVSVFEVGRDGEHIFIVSELINGLTLRDKIKQGTINEERSTRLMHTIASAMQDAHETGIAHRDLKPGNILLDEQGNPHVADFGLAKLISAEDMTLTKAGRIMGTPAYMSPEQASGNSSTADSRTDIYAMGVIYYELLTGKKPYENLSTTILDEIQAGDAPGVRDIAPHISRDAAAICEKAMAVAPIDRYQTSDEFAYDLDALLQGRSVRARPTGKLQSVFRLAKRNLPLVATATGFLVFTAILLAFGNPFSSSQPSQPNASSDQLELRTVRIKITGDGDSNLSVYGIDDERKLLSKEPLKTKALSGNEFQFEAEPGFYLLKAISGARVDEFYRVVPTGKSGTTSSRFSSQLMSNDVIDGMVHLHPFIQLTTDDPNYHIHTMINVPGGVFKGGSQQVRRMGNATEFRFHPDREHPIAPFEVSETEVTAFQFRQVMGRHPQAMMLKPNKSVDPNLPVTNVNWMEAVEYAERTGTRLPTFLEYRYLATNFGQTEFPSPAAASIKKWPIAQVKVPADEVNSIGVYNLYSSVGEWAWDINLKGEVQIAEIPNTTGSWRYERIVYGIPSSSYKTPAISRHVSENTESIIDLPFHAIDQRLGFRVVRPKNAKSGN